MLFATAKNLIGTDREATGDGWVSRRFLIAEDGFPFSVHETAVASGTEIRVCYTTHSETVYCIEGKASIEIVAEGKILPIEPGTFYTVQVGDDHVLRTELDTKFLCIFNPPLSGSETADGTSG